MDDRPKAQLASAYAEWRGELFRLLRGRVGCEAEAADLTREAFAHRGFVVDDP